MYTSRPRHPLALAFRILYILLRLTLCASIATPRTVLPESYTDRTLKRNHVRSDSNPISDYNSARECFRSLESWGQNSYDWVKQNIVTTTDTVTSTVTVNLTLGAFPTYKLCDGIPRVSANAISTGSITKTVETWSWSYTITEVAADQGLPEYTVPEPECAVEKHLCTTLVSSWSKEKHITQAVLYENGSYPSRVAAPTFNPLTGVCRETWNCVVSARQFALIYWPPAITSRDICAENGAGTAITLSPESGPSGARVGTLDAITFGTHRYGDGVPLEPDEVTHEVVMTGPFTFTSPSVYIAYKYLRNSAQSGPTSVYSTGILTLKPQDLYSVVPRWDAFDITGKEYARSMAMGIFPLKYGLWNRFELQSFNLANLENPVPANAYFDSREDCWASNAILSHEASCATITDDTYRPWIAINPSVLGSVNPDWTTCFQPPWGSLDPPRILSEAEIKSVEVPTLRTPSAQPVAGPTQSWPKPTALELADSQVIDPRPTAVLTWPGASSSPSEITAHRGGVVSIGSERVRPGQSATIDGHVVAVENGRIVMDGSKTVAFANPTHNLVVGTATIPVKFEHGWPQIGHMGQDIGPGQEATIDGKVLSFAQDAVLVDGRVVMSISSPKAAGNGGFPATLSGPTDITSKFTPESNPDGQGNKGKHTQSKPAKNSAPSSHISSYLFFCLFAAVACLRI